MCTKEKTWVVYEYLFYECGNMFQVVKEGREIFGLWQSKIFRRYLA